MQQLDLRLIAKQNLKPTLWEFTLAGDSPSPEPGQFYLVRCLVSYTIYLRRPIFPQAGSPAWDTQVTFLLNAKQTIDAGYAWLASRQVGEKLNVLGVLGKGFRLPELGQNLLLIGEGQDISPLLGLLQQATERRLNVGLAIESFSARDMYDFQTLPCEVELYLATRDGSLGHQGSIINHLADLPRWADAIYAVGSNDFLRHLKHHLQEKFFHLPSDFVQALPQDLPLHICGVGTCLGCAIHTSKGLRPACTDGPVFDLMHLDI